VQIIILADGMGARAGDLAVAEPGALVEAAGHPLVDYALAFAGELGAEHRIVVGGFSYREVAAHVEAHDTDAVLVDNADYRKGNLLSFLAGRARLEPGGFVLLRVERVYRPAVARAVSEMAGRTAEVTVFGDTGLLYVPAERVAPHGDAAHRVLEEIGESATTGDVLALMAKDGRPAHVVPLEGGWLEVVTPDDRLQANQVLAAERWWPALAR
jgi:CTP:molybdopterin cytidylyltransferase MocA